MSGRHLSVRLLGPVEALDGGQPVELAGGKARALLALLLLRAGQTVTRTQIVDDLWGEQVPESATKMVQIYVSQLRKALGHEVIVTRGNGYSLSPAELEVDVAEFARLTALGREQLARDPGAAAATFDEALGLWRGPALAELEEPFAGIEAARLEEMRLGCLEDRAEAMLECGRHREIAGELEGLAARYPLRPKLHGQLITALYRSGRHAEALAAYRAHRDTLDELGIEPAQQLRDLERRVLQQDPALEWRPRPATAVAAADDHATRLLERDDALASLEAASASAAAGRGVVVLVTGEPGIGKTMLVSEFLRGLPPGTRALLGTCDDLSVPRPLGPFHDLANAVSPELAAALAHGASSSEIQRLLLAELERPPSPTVLVVEDVHWADDATLDVLKIVGRRIASLPALLVLTYRPGDAPPGHPLLAAIGALRSDTEVIELEPLSEEAVAQLVGNGAESVFSATAGNPFYVTELVACGPTAEPPRSVTNAVLGRIARLDEPSRELLELVSVVPNRTSTALLDAAAPDWTVAAAEPERRQLLEIGPTHVRFRHELARNAVRANLPVATRRRLHAAILRHLVEGDGDAADVVHHAEAAGDTAVVAEFALVAARRAAAVDSHREAYSHYCRAADLAEGRPVAEQAVIFEELAQAAYLVHHTEAAVPAIERAVELYGELSDLMGVGRCTRILARLLWFTGAGEAARWTMQRALTILEPLGDSVELARAYSVLAGLEMLAPRCESAVRWGDRAIALAARLGDEQTRISALVTIGTAKAQLDHDDTAPLQEAQRQAEAAGEHYESARALHNLGATSLYWSQPERARTLTAAAHAYAERHDMRVFAAYSLVNLAVLDLRAGDWEAAEAVSSAEIERHSSVARLLAREVAAMLAIRRGDPGATETLEELIPEAGGTLDLQRIVPVLELAIEAALLYDTPLPRPWFDVVLATARPEMLHGWVAARLAAWAPIVGVEPDWEAPAPAQLAAMARSDWRAAAEAFGDVGWEHDRALMLSLLDEPDALREAAAVAARLGAAPLSARIERRLMA